MLMNKIDYLFLIIPKVDNLLASVNGHDLKVVVQKVNNIVTAANILLDLRVLEGNLLPYSLESWIVLVILKF